MVDVAEAAIQLLRAFEFLLPARPLECLFTLSGCGMLRARACGAGAFDVLDFDGGAPNEGGRLASGGELFRLGRISGLERGLACNERTRQGSNACSGHLLSP